MVEHQTVGSGNQGLSPPAAVSKLPMPGEVTPFLTAVL